MDEALRRLREHLRVIDDDVAPVHRRYASHIQCRAGCSDCCHQTFRISALEATWLAEGLRGLGESERADILARARDYRPDERSPCPILDRDGRCRLYRHRPRICRKYGIPLWHPDRPEEVRTCPKNFQGVVDLDAELIVEPQARWAAEWIRMREAMAPQVASTGTIAELLLAAVETGDPAAPPGANG